MVTYFSIQGQSFQSTRQGLWKVIRTSVSRGLLFTPFRIHAVRSRSTLFEGPSSQWGALWAFPQAGITPYLSCPVFTVTVRP